MGRHREHADAPGRRDPGERGREEVSGQTAGAAGTRAAETDGGNAEQDRRRDGDAETLRGGEIVGEEDAGWGGRGVAPRARGRRAGRGKGRSGGAYSGATPTPERAGRTGGTATTAPTRGTPGRVASGGAGATPRRPARGATSPTICCTCSREGRARRLGLRVGFDAGARWKAARAAFFFT